MSHIRRRATTLIATLACIVPIGLSLAAPAAQAQGAGPVTDYAAYPEALPVGCPDGADVVTDVRFDNGRGATETDLRRLDVRNGDTLTMSWQDYAPGCRTPGGEPAIVISMAAYDAGTGTFDPTFDQRLLPGWTSCGPGMAPCRLTGGRYQLSLTVPGTEIACNIQTGAIIGLPLAVVGPHGSYYNSLIRGDQRPDMLIAATNFVTVPCPPPSVAPLVTVSPTIVPPSTVPPTTVPPSTVPAAAGAAAAEASTPSPPTTVTPLPSSAVEAAAADRNLPTTGRNDTGPMVIALTLLGLGGAALAAERLAVRRRIARPTSSRQR
jgi:hypothetical protein